MAGRKQKLDRAALNRAVQLKKGGANNKDIAAAIGICEQTFYKWVNQPKTPLQSELSEQLKKAEADYKNALLAIIAKAGKEKDWRASAWLLEQRSTPAPTAYRLRSSRTRRPQSSASCSSTTATNSRAVCVCVCVIMRVYCQHLEEG